MSSHNGNIKSNYELFMAKQKLWDAIFHSLTFFLRRSFGVKNWILDSCIVIENNMIAMKI